MATLDDAKIKLTIDTDAADRDLDDLEKQVDRLKKKRGEEEDEKEKTEEKRKKEEGRPEARPEERRGGVSAALGPLAAAVGIGVSAVGAIRFVTNILNEQTRDSASPISQAINQLVEPVHQATVKLQEEIDSVKNALPSVSDTVTGLSAFTRAGGESLPPATVKEIFDAFHGVKNRQTQIDRYIADRDSNLTVDTMKAVLGGVGESVKQAVGK